jgi:tRNA(His) 5'-end guanylyltransferase
MLNEMRSDPLWSPSIPETTTEKNEDEWIDEGKDKSNNNNNKDENNNDNNDLGDDDHPSSALYSQSYYPRANLNFRQIADVLKSFEATCELTIPREEGFCIRLDGVNFARFTRQLCKPYDEVFVMAMVKTMNDCLHKYSASTGYCQSDEISLFFPPCSVTSSGHIWDGRVQKAASVISSYATIRFNRHIIDGITIANRHIEASKNKTHASNPLEEPIPDPPISIPQPDMTPYMQFVQKHSHSKQLPPTKNRGKSPYQPYDIASIEQACPHFDGRVCPLPHPLDACAYFEWRSMHDSFRNSVSNYASQFFRPRELEGLSSHQKIKKLEVEANLDWGTVPPHHKFGVYAKKETFERLLDPSVILHLESRHQEKNTAQNSSNSSSSNSNNNIDQQDSPRLNQHQDDGNVHFRSESENAVGSRKKNSHPRPLHIPSSAIRHRIRNRTIIMKCDYDYLDLLVAKTWPTKIATESTFHQHNHHSANSNDNNNNNSHSNYSNDSIEGVHTQDDIVQPEASSSHISHQQYQQYPRQLVFDYVDYEFPFS